jgi:hypothetical protein
MKRLDFIRHMKELKTAFVVLHYVLIYLDGIAKI